MIGHTSRALGSSRTAAFIPVAFEPLESRRLLSVTLSLTAGVLLVHESASGVNNTTTIQLMNDGTEIMIEESPQTVTESGALLGDGWVDDGHFGGASGPETGISSIVVDTNDGNDTVSLLSMNLPVTIQPNGLADEDVEIGGQNAPLGAQEVTQPVTIDASRAHSLEIDMDDRQDTGNVDPTLTSTSVLDFAGADINFTAPTLATAPVVIVSCLAGVGTSGFVLAQDPANPTAISYQVESAGPGTFSVQKLNANSSVHIEPTTTGSERVFVGASGLISGIHGSVAAFFTQGPGSVVVNDSSDTVGQTFAASGSGGDFTLLDDGATVVTCFGSLMAFTLDTGTARNTVDVASSSQMQGFVATVQAAGTDDTVAVRQMPAESTLDLIGGAGTDAVEIDSTFCLGSIQFSNPTGLDAVTIDASSTSTPQVISVSDSLVTGLGSQSIAMANLKSLSVIGGSAFDNFSVTPSAAVPITVDGGADSGTPADRLDVNTSQATSTQLTLQTTSTGDQGRYTFGNRQPIIFSRFAEITPAFGDLTGTLFDEQNAAPVAGVPIVIDTNNNGAADPGEPTATTGSDGTFSFSGLPTGTFGLLVISNAWSLVSPSSVTVAAGALPAPLAVAVAPLATVGAADLIAAISVPSGKSATSKPKVSVKITNIGSAPAAAPSIQVALFASADQTLDLQDSPLLTFATPALLLKPKASKRFVLTGSTAASLATGRYSILASVDAGNAVAESNELNNVAVSGNQVLLGAPLADLTGKFGAVRRSALQNTPLTVPLTVQNTGTISATGTIEIDFFASTDNTLDDADTEIGAGFPFAAHVAAGKSQAAKFKISLAAVPAGTYFLIARINSTQTLGESTFGNNVISSPIAIAIS